MKVLNVNWPSYNNLPPVTRPFASCFEIFTFQVHVSANTTLRSTLVLHCTLHLLQLLTSISNILKSLQNIHYIILSSICKHRVYTLSICYMVCSYQSSASISDINHNLHFVLPIIKHKEEKSVRKWSIDSKSSYSQRYCTLLVASCKSLYTLSVSTIEKEKNGMKNSGNLVTIRFKQQIIRHKLMRSLGISALPYAFKTNDKIR